MPKTLFNKAKEIFPNVPDDKILLGYYVVKTMYPNISDEDLLNTEEELKKKLKTSYLAREIVKEKRKLKDN